MKPVLSAIAFLLFASSTRAEWNDSFEGPDRLITNEYAYHNPQAADAVVSPNWNVTSGSLFSKGGSGWTGRPDASGGAASAAEGTHSSVFRMTTKREDFGDVSVSFLLNNQGLSSTPNTPMESLDGIHIFLRHQSEEHTYYASINRRDDTALIKKKVPGGPVNGGTYYLLAGPVRNLVPYNSWQRVRATVMNQADGSVTISLYAGSRLLVSATDTGTGGPPIRKPGRVGIRGDNADALFDDFTVTSLNEPAPAPASALASASGAASQAPAPTDARAKERFLSPALADGINDAAVFGPDAREVSVFDIKGASVFQGISPGGARITWDCRDGSGRIVESGVYIARIRTQEGGALYQSFAVVK